VAAHLVDAYSRLPVGEALKSLAFTGVVGLLALSLVACGDVRGSSSSDGQLDEYYSELESILDGIGNRVLGSGAPEVGPGASVEEGRAILADYLSGIATKTDAEIDKIAELAPPPEVQSLHNAYVSALRTLSGLFEDFAKQAAAATTRDEVRASVDVPTGDAAVSNIQAACVALQSFANDRGNDIDLDCEA
jgi:hypothetical protein